MGLKDKMFAKAIDGIDLEALRAKVTDAIYAKLHEAGHTMQGSWSNDKDWTADCLNCDFVAQGNSGGKLAIDKMAEVHLTCLNDTA